MKKIYLLVLIAVLFSSCAVQIESVVDNSLFEKPYTNPLIVLSYDNYNIQRFSNELKENLELQFKAENKKVEVRDFNLMGSALSLNARKGVNQEINDILSNDNKDLLLVFKPTDITLENGGYRVFTYQLTGIDVNSKKEVWKANFTATRGNFGAAKMAEQASEIIYEKLKTDKVL